MEVVVTEQALFRTRRDYARARYNYLLDTLRLKFAAGTLTSADLAAASAASSNDEADVGLDSRYRTC